MESSLGMVFTFCKSNGDVLMGRVMVGKGMLLGYFFPIILYGPCSSVTFEIAVNRNQCRQQQAEPSLVLRPKHKRSWEQSAVYHLKASQLFLSSIPR